MKAEPEGIERHILHNLFVLTSRDCKRSAFISLRGRSLDLCGDVRLCLRGHRMVVSP